MTSVSSGGNVTFDNTAPTINTAAIASNNTVTTLAKVGDVVTVSIVSAENLHSISGLTVNSQSVDVAQVTKTSATQWSFTYTMTSSDTEGDLGYGFTANDLPGNSIALTYSSSLTFDRTAPTLSAVSISSNNAVNTLAKVGDAITVAFTSSETVQDPPTVTIGGTGATVSGSGTSWSATRTMASGDSEGGVVFAINFLDLTGNAGTQVTATTDASGITFDKTAPTMSAIAIASNNANYTTLAKVDDSVKVTFTSSETIQTPTSTIGGFNADISGATTSWIAAKLMTISDSEGSVGLTIDYMDLAGNDGTQSTATVGGSDVVFDKTAPTMAVTIVSDNPTTTLAKPDDNVTITITSSENLYQPPTVAIDGNTETVNPSTQATSYTSTRVMQTSDSQGDITFVVGGISDLAGNTVTNLSLIHI